MLHPVAGFQLASVHSMEVRSDTERDYCCGRWPDGPPAAGAKAKTRKAPPSFIQPGSAAWLGADGPWTPLRPLNHSATLSMTRAICRDEPEPCPKPCPEIGKYDLRQSEAKS